MYLAFREHNWTAAGIGTAFLVFTAIRVHTVVRALSERRSRNRTVSAATGAAADTVPQPQPGVGSATFRKEPNVWGQAFAALAVFGALGAAVWVAFSAAPDANSAPEPASCSDSAHEKLPQAYARKPKPVTGDELCAALNRPDLAQLLGTPDEVATTASGTDNTAPLTDGKIAQPEAEVRFDTYTVNFSATYNKLSIAQLAELKKTGGEEARTDEVRGRPAVFSSDHTMQFDISLGGEESSAPVEEGPLARTLSVAFDRKDGGGYYDITVWSTSGAFPTDGVLLNIAEEVLPTVPGWTAP
ncbi:DUF6215 domain-containing protein [Streptomyces sp. NPDC058382]